MTSASQNARKVAGNSRIYNYRGFFCIPHPYGWLVKWPLKHTNPDVPREFEWHSFSKPELHEYLDALVENRSVTVQLIEDAGIPSNFKWWRDDGEKEFCSVSPRRLCDIIFGVDPLNIPCDGVIKFVLHKGRFYATQILAELVAKEFFPKSLTEWPAKQVNLSDGAVARSGINTDLGLDPALYGAFQEVEVEDGDLPAADRTHIEEALIFNEHYGTHRELISMVEGDGQTPFFVRRIYRENDLIWEGSAMDVEGPWIPYTKDEARCKALGITDDADLLNAEDEDRVSA